MTRVRDGEKTSKWVPSSEPVDLGKAGLGQILARYQEIDENLIPALVEERDAIKVILKKFGTDFVIQDNGEDLYRVRQDGQFRTAEFAKVYPTEAEECTVVKQRKVIDPDLVEQLMGPGIRKQFLTQKIEKIKK